MTRPFTLLACMALLACAAQSSTGSPDLSREPPTVRVALGAPFTLRMGESAEVDGRLRVTALAVTEDSRCPVNAVCVWAGDAAVEVLLEGGAAAARTDTLHTLLGSRGTTTYGSLALTLVVLDPLPMAGEKISTYKATLRADKLDAGEN